MRGQIAWGFLVVLSVSLMLSGLGSQAEAGLVPNLICVDFSSCGLYPCNAPGAVCWAGYWWWDCTCASWWTVYGWVCGCT